MMTLFHGSYIEIKTPLANVGRRNLDFGKGFYLTKVEKQAINDNVKFKIFESYNLEWLQFVVNCRNGRDVYSQYDVIEGGVADDKVIDTVEDYEKGIITAEQAIGQLLKKDVNHQICILNQNVIDKYITFIKSISW